MPGIVKMIRSEIFKNAESGKGGSKEGREGKEGREFREAENSSVSWFILTFGYRNVLFFQTGKNAGKGQVSFAAEEGMPLETGTGQAG